MYTQMLQLVLVLILVPPAPQRQNFAVQGTLTFEDALTSPAIVVFLESLDSRPVKRARANAAGNFLFPNVEPGIYYVRVKHAGFKEFAQRIEVPAFNRPVVISLERDGDVLAANTEIFFPDDFETDLRQFDIPEEAIREYENAVDDDKRGRAARALQGFRRALGIAPNFIAAAFRFASGSYKAGRLEDAEGALVRTLKSVPAASHLRLLLANIFVKQRKYEQALLQIDLVLEQNPDDVERAPVEAARSRLIRAMAQ
jgi:tetratricopeptide (TPR) repeat protein